MAAPMMRQVCRGACAEAEMSDDCGDDGRRDSNFGEGNHWLFLHDDRATGNPCGGVTQQHATTTSTSLPQPPNDQASAAALQEASLIDRDGMVARTDVQNRRGKAVGLEAIVRPQPVMRFSLIHPYRSAAEMGISLLTALPTPAPHCL
jgi:hypothetical protein